MAPCEKLLRPYFFCKSVLSTLVCLWLKILATFFLESFSIPTIPTLYNQYSSVKFKVKAFVYIPKKKSKNNPLSREDKMYNKQLFLNEHVIGKIKRFKIVADKYRNRRKRFGLRFNLIAGVYNLELSN
jgi:hypothetical protein